MALVASNGWFEPDEAFSARRISPVLVLVGDPSRRMKIAAHIAKKATSRAAGGPLAMWAGAGGVAIALSVGASQYSGISSAAARAADAAGESLRALGLSMVGNSLVVDAGCGAVACGAMDAVYGIDTLKVRLQSGTKLFEGGIRGLYQGVGASAAFRVLHGALYMPVYTECKHAMQAAQAPLAAAVVASATAATVLVSLVEVPVEALLLRIKSGRAASGFLSAARSALTTPGGVSALYFGAGPFVARHVLYESLEFLTYETLRARAVAKQHALGGAASAHGAAADGGHGAGLAPGQAALIAFAASAVATVASQPLDCIRVACSLSAGGGAAHGAAAHAAGPAGLSTLSVVRGILRAKGPAGFFAGLLPRLATLAPGAVIFFSTFEATKGASERLRVTLAAAESAKAAALGPGPELSAAPQGGLAGAGGALAAAAEEVADAVLAGHAGGAAVVASHGEVLALASASRC